MRWRGPRRHGRCVSAAVCTASTLAALFDGESVVDARLRRVGGAWIACAQTDDGRCAGASSETADGALERTVELLRRLTRPAA